MKRHGPDSIRSWIVMSAVFVIKFLSYGIIEITGMYMIATMNRYDITREQASLPYTLIYCVRNTAGPLIGYVGSIIGTRLTTLFGCILSSIAIGACFFAENILALTLLWAGLFGIGHAFSTLHLSPILIEHFEQHLAKATGISYTGLQLGCLFFGTLLEYMESTFGLSGAFLIIAGISLNNIPASLIIFFNQPEDHKTKSPQRSTFLTVFSEKVSIKSDVKRTYCVTPNHAEVKQPKIYTVKFNALISSPETGTETTFESHLRRSLVPVTNGDRKTLGKDSSVCDSKTLENDYIQNHSPSCLNLDDNLLSRRTKRDETVLFSSTENELYSKSEQKEQTEILLIPESLSCEPSHDQENSACKNNEMSPSKHIFTEMLCDPVYFLLLVSGAIYMFSLSAFLTISMDYAIDIGLKKSHIKYVLTDLYISELLGNLFLGYITDGGYLSCHKFAVLCFLVDSVTLLLVVWIKDYVVYLILIAIYQIANAGILFNYSSLTNDLFKKELWSPVMSSMFFLSAPFFLLLSPLIGYFRDKRGSYDGVFYSAAGMQALGCVLHLVLPWIHKNRNKVKQ